MTDNGAEYLGSGAEPAAGVLVEVTDEADPGRRFSGVTDNLGRYSIAIPGTGIGENGSGAPGAFGLSQNFPNPFNPSTVIAYQLSRPADIRIDVHDLLGRRVKTLLSGFRSETEGQVVWNATDASGRCVPAGVYIYSLTAEGKSVSRKMLLIDGGMSPSGTGLSKRSASIRMPARAMSDRYRVCFSGMNIETLEQAGITISGPTVLDVTVRRTVTDIDGNVYRTVRIGNQWWTAENLRTVHYRNGEPIPNVTDNSAWSSLTTGAYCDYENNSDNVSTYGRLYNWFAVMDSRNLAPEGWHVPTDAEWQALINTLGGSSVAGGKMKEEGTTHWSFSSETVKNESGFTALPAGGRFFGGSLNMGTDAFFWSSSERDAGNAWRVNLNYLHLETSRKDYFKEAGFSVRLVRD
ncbi:MAG: FISUMP domain-containing protein [bacterium]|nr:FISUMP domain-containing protein [bacterium]